MEKVGVFLCHCDLNISGDIDVKKVLDAVSQYPGVVHVEDCKDLCLPAGLDLLREAIAEKGLKAVVLNSCSPGLHEGLFRQTVVSMGLSPYAYQIVNLRDICGWPLVCDKEEATERAIEAIKASLDKLEQGEAFAPVSVPITKRALVIGGGIAGIQAALDIADGGYEVILVEKTSSIGGRMIQLSETFPTLDCPQCIETPKMVDVSQHPNIKLMPYCEVEEVSGSVGNFTVKIRKKATYVDWDKCTGCGDCMEKCPYRRIPAEFDCYLGNRRAIYRPFPQAVPNRPIIDTKGCVRFLRAGAGDTRERCRACALACQSDAINFEMQDTFVEEKVGAIVVATGYDVFPKENITEYPNDPDIIDGLQMERLLSSTGPTAGQMKRPSDGQVPQEVVFIQCVGSRDPAHYFPYCSRVCCMYTAKQAMLYKHAVHEGQAYVFYMDIRADGKGYEEFIQRAMEEDKVLYIRGRVSKIFRQGKKLVVWGIDTLSGNNVEIPADLVVLAVALVPSAGTRELAQKLGVAVDENGFMTEANAKLGTMESVISGIYLAGMVQGLRDIPDSVQQASGAASKVLDLFAKDEMLLEPALVAATV